MDQVTGPATFLGLQWIGPGVGRSNLAYAEGPRQFVAGGPGRRRLLGAAAKSRNKELRAAVVVALNTGLRLGELIGLTSERVDLSRGVIRLEMTKTGRRREVQRRLVRRSGRPVSEKQWPGLQDPLHQDRLQQRRRGGPA